LMTGGCEGAASGAGIRFSKAGICGAGDPRRVVGFRTKPPRLANPPPCPKPPRAKPGVDPTTQAAANAKAAMNFFMTHLLGNIALFPATTALIAMPAVATEIGRWNDRISIFRVDWITKFDEVLILWFGFC
jgi:hypothetical protein